MTLKPQEGLEIINLNKKKINASIIDISKYASLGRVNS